LVELADPDLLGQAFFCGKNQQDVFFDRHFGLLGSRLRKKWTLFNIFMEIIIVGKQAISRHFTLD